MRCGLSWELIDERYPEALQVQCWRYEAGERILDAARRLGYDCPTELS